MMITPTGVQAHKRRRELGEASAAVVRRHPAVQDGYLQLAGLLTSAFYEAGKLMSQTTER